MSCSNHDVFCGKLFCFLRIAHFKFSPKRASQGDHLVFFVKWSSVFLELGVGLCPVLGFGFLCNFLGIEAESWLEGV